MLEVPVRPPLQRQCWSCWSHPPRRPCGSSLARHSEEGVRGKESDGDDEEEEEDNEANGGNGEGVEDNEEDDEEDHPSSELTPILPRVPTPGVTCTRPHKIGGMAFAEKDYDIPLPCTTPTEAERRRSLRWSRVIVRHCAWIEGLDEKYHCSGN